MDHDTLLAASRRLAELDISIDVLGCSVIVNWFRVMMKTGNWRIARHAHTSYEFHLIAEGGCVVQTDTDVFRVSKGEFYLTPPNVHHSQSQDGDGGCIEYSLDFEFRRKDGPLHGEMSSINEFMSMVPCRPFKDDQGIMALFDRALSEAHGRRPGCSVVVSALVPEILVLMARAMGYSSCQSGGHDRNGVQQSRMELIESFVCDNIRDHIAPADIASYMNLSEKQVSRIVLASEGFSTKRYIIGAKIEEAKRMLLSTDESISDISRTLSFSSPSYFVNVFTRTEGISPGAFRAQNKEGSRS